jgi:hypothetical protein
MPEPTWQRLCHELTTTLFFFFHPETGRRYIQHH